MHELPDEIWNHILEFTFDWKLTHKQKMKPILENNIIGCYTVIYYYYSFFPPPSWQNTTDIILAEYVNNERLPYAPPPGLPLASITWNVNSNGNGGWWCGYGWRKNVN
jgi:hypothetical protein